MPASFQYASDLHIEFTENKKFLKRNPILPAAEVLVLAGDIVPFVALDQHKDFFNQLSDQFETVYWLPGNHEYYHFDISTKRGTFHDKIRSNIFLVNNTAVVHNDVKLIFTTLWTKISPGAQFYIERSMNDFHLIKNNGFRLTADDYNELHSESMNFLHEELSSVSDKKQLVFTHHCPSFLNYPEQYKGDDLNEAFAVELYDLIESSGVMYWVYGHHHCNTAEFSIGETRLITNQLGYVQRNEHLLFNREKTVEI